MASEDPVYYKVHSMVRRVQTRLHRQRAAGRHRFVQRLAGGDITVRRARPATISAAQLEVHFNEIKAAVDEGKVEVRTPTGVVVDLSTMRASPAPSKAANKIPETPLDSASNDKTFEHGVGEVALEDQPLDAPDVSNSLVGDEEDAVVAGGQDPAKIRKSKRGQEK